MIRNYIYGAGFIVDASGSGSDDDPPNTCFLVTLVYSCIWYVSKFRQMCGAVWGIAWESTCASRKELNLKASSGNIHMLCHHENVGHCAVHGTPSVSGHTLYLIVSRPTSVE